MAKDAASGKKKARGSAPGPRWGQGPQTPILEGKEGGTRGSPEHSESMPPSLPSKKMQVQGGSPWRGSGGRAPSLSQPERRAYVTQALADLVPGLTRAAYRRRSPAGALLMSEWGSVVGPRLAIETSPKRLVGGTLTIACSGAMAMELQHLSAAVIERINAHAGHRLVERLRFVQEPVMAVVAPVRRRMEAPVPLAELPPGELNDALARLRAALRTR